MLTRLKWTLTQTPLYLPQTACGLVDNALTLKQIALLVKNYFFHSKATQTSQLVKAMLINFTLMV